MRNMTFTDLNSITTKEIYRPEPKILLYNFAQDGRTRALLSYLSEKEIHVRQVLTPEFLHPLGYLFDIPGFSPNSEFNMGKNFTDEMVVMKDFSNTQLEEFLQFFRDTGLKKIDLKAMLTPVTIHWNSLALHDELLEEHRSMNK